MTFYVSTVSPARPDNDSDHAKCRGVSQSDSVLRVFAAIVSIIIERILLSWGKKSKTFFGPKNVIYTPTRTKVGPRVRGDLPHKI